MHLGSGRRSAPCPTEGPGPSLPPMQAERGRGRNGTPSPETPVVAARGGPPPLRSPLVKARAGGRAPRGRFFVGGQHMRPELQGPSGPWGEPKRQLLANRTHTWSEDGAVSPLHTHPSVQPVSLPTGKATY